MLLRKCLKIPVHHRTTKSKIAKLDKLTARITYCTRLISTLVLESEDITLDRTYIRNLVKESDIASVTGLSYGFRDQCIDKVIWSWRSYMKLHADWEKRIAFGAERLERRRPVGSITGQAG